MNFNGGGNLMVFRACQDMKDASGRVTIGYSLSSPAGEIRFMTNKQIKDLINSGNVVIGLKLNKAGRLIIDRSGYGAINARNRVEVLSGEKLKHTAIKRAGKFKRRKYVQSIVKFCLEKPTNRVMLIHGLRRTGKTIQMNHAVIDCIRTGIDSKRLHMLQVSRLNNKEVVTCDEIDNIIRNILTSVSDPIIFIDEITFVKDVVNYLNRLQDFYEGVQFILTGTDSFVFSTAVKDTLFGRAITIHTQYIGYQEFKDLLPEQSLDDYIKGLIFTNNSYYTGSEYIKDIKEQTYGNIIGTINRSKDYFFGNANQYIGYIQKIKGEDLLYIIFNILSTVTSPKDNKDFIKSLKSLGGAKIRFIANTTGAQWDDIPKKQSELASKKLKQLKYVMDILQELDVIKQVDNLAVKLIDSDQLTNRGFKVITEKEICCVIQSMAFQICQQCVANKENLTGILNENLVLSCLQMLYGNRLYDGHKNYEINETGYLKYSVKGVEHEIDAVLALKQDAYSSEYDLIEVKSGTYPRHDYCKHLLEDSANLPKELSDESLIHKRIVIYNGISCEKYGVQFVNLEEFLLDPCKWL